MSDLRDFTAASLSTAPTALFDAVSTVLTGQAEIIQKQHIKEVLEANKRQQNEWEYGKLIGNTQRHHQKVADIPNLLYVQLKEKFGHPADNPKDWARWLNDPDNRHFRTGGGRI